MVKEKRPAPAATSTSTPANSSKKRKMNVQKYYAVQVGYQRGVYMTWPECQQQTTGYRGAVFKSFTTREEAEEFAAGKKVESARDKPVKFYAVASGHFTGIFTEWEVASKAIKSAKLPKYKGFATRAEAVDFIRKHGDLDAIRALGEEPALELQPEPKPDEEEPPAKKSKISRKRIPETPDDGVIRIYTDGSSRANGQKGARAGLGVFFGNGDPRNLAERLKGEPQTNQRAELMAMFRALEIAPLDQPVQIFSDSQYSINCVTQWAVSWERKQWKTSAGQDVKNQDIIRLVLAKMKERLAKGGNTTFQWVKGHAADAGNEAADHLAVRGADMPRLDA